MFFRTRNAIPVGFVCCFSACEHRAPVRIHRAHIYQNIDIFTHYNNRIVPYRVVNEKFFLHSLFKNCPVLHNLKIVTRYASFHSKRTAGGIVLRLKIHHSSIVVLTDMPYSEKCCKACISLLCRSRTYLKHYSPSVSSGNEAPAVSAVSAA